MINLKKNLLDLCSFRGKDMIQNIKTFRLERILLDFVKSKDSKTYEEVKISMAQQKINNYFFLKAIREITEKCEKANIKIVHIKGLSLASDIYDDIDVRRVSDIDIVIDRTDIREVFGILGQLGWSLMSGELLTSQIYSDNEIYKHISRVCHFPVVKKHYRLFNMHNIVFMDLHIRIYNDFSYESPYMEGILGRTVQCDMLGLKIWELELHDKILHLLNSFTKEHIDTIGNETLTGKITKHIVKVNLLYDIALLIAKYNNDINWGILLERVRELDKEGELLFAIRMFDFVFPSVIPSEFFEKVKKNFKKYNKEVYTDGFKRRCIPYLLDINPKDFFYKPMSEIYINMLKKLYWVGPVFEIDKENKNQKYNRMFIIDNSENSIMNQFETQFKFHSDHYEMNNELFMFGIKYNEKGLLLNIEKYYLNKEDNYWDNKEYFWITLGGQNGESSIMPQITLKRIEFELSSNYDKNNIKSWEVYGAGRINRNISFGEYNDFKVLNIKRTTNYYNVELLIPWKTVNIDFQLCNEIWFDFEGELSNQDIVCFANPKSTMFDDPSLLCKLRFNN